MNHTFTCARSAEGEREREKLRARGREKNHSTGSFNMPFGRYLNDSNTNKAQYSPVFNISE